MNRIEKEFFSTGFFENDLEFSVAPEVTHYSPNVGRRTFRLSLKNVAVATLAAGILFVSGAVVEASATEPTIQITVYKSNAERSARMTEQFEPGDSGLADRMAQNAAFKDLVDKGLADLKEGRYSKLKNTKQRRGDI